MVETTTEAIQNAAADIVATSEAGNDNGVEASDNPSHALGHDLQTLVGMGACLFLGCGCIVGLGVWIRRSGFGRWAWANLQGLLSRGQDGQTPEIEVEGGHSDDQTIDPKSQPTLCPSDLDHGRPATAWIENEVRPGLSITEISEEIDDGSSAKPNPVPLIEGPDPQEALAAPAKAEALNGPPIREALETSPPKPAIKLDLSDDRLLRQRPGRSYISPRRGRRGQKN